MLWQAVRLTIYERPKYHTSQYWSQFDPPTYRGTGVEVKRGRFGVPTGFADRLARRYLDSTFASSKSFCNLSSLCSSVDPGNRNSSRSRPSVDPLYWVESGYMLSGRHLGLASCIPLPEEVLSGSSDSNSMRLWGPSHGILPALSGASVHGISSVSSSARRLRPTNWVWAALYGSSVYSIPESIVFRVSCPAHLGRTHFISIQFLSGGRPVVGKFSACRSS